jgi:1,4-dihydroxy-2-naphthoate octaprenyltransferase
VRGNSLATHARRLWLATRPAFLTASVLPVLVGSAWGYLVADEFHALSFTLAVLATVLVHAASNVLNDVGDDIGGTDNANEERIFPYTGGSRFIQNGVMSAREMKSLGRHASAARAGARRGAHWLHGPQVLIFGAVGIALGVLYSVPKVQLSAHGLGETAVALAFGVLPVVGAAWLQSGVISTGSFAISIPVALWVAAILLINEVPDIRADAAAGKRTLVVRLGVAATRRIYAGIQLRCDRDFPFVWCVRVHPLVDSPSSLLLLPQAIGAARSICDVSEDRARLTHAIETTLKLHLSGCFLLVIAALVTRFVSS